MIHRQFRSLAALLCFVPLSLFGCGSGESPYSAPSQGSNSEPTTGAPKVVTGIDSKTLNPMTLPSTNPPGIPDGYIRQPAGWFHSSCVKEIPNGGSVDDQGNVTVNGTFIRQDPTPCPYAPILTTPGAPNSEGAGITGTDAGPPPDYQGYLEYAYQWSEGVGANMWDDVYVTMTVPDNPYIDNSQTIYLFPGLESSAACNSGNCFIYQPVLQYGCNPTLEYCTTWSFATYYVTGSGYSYYSPPLFTETGDTIYTYMAIVADNSGGFDWEIYASDQYYDYDTYQTETTSRALDFFISSALETYGLDSCYYLPQNDYAYFSGIALYAAKPNWNSYIKESYNPSIGPYGASPACGYDVDILPTGTYLFWRYND